MLSSLVVVGTLLSLIYVGNRSNVLAANVEFERYPDQQLRTLPVKGATHVYKGALLGIDAVTGCVRGLLEGDDFAGIADEEINNTGADAAKSVRVYTQGDFDFELTGASKLNNGKPLYANSDDAVGLVAVIGFSFVGIQVSLGDVADHIVMRIMPGQGQPAPLV